ncbi:MAG: hypothetical protein WBY88_07000 [Desulfosarcina sp.]
MHEAAGIVSTASASGTEALRLEYLERMLKHSGIVTGHAGQIGIQYLKEIGRDVRTVRAGLSVINGTVNFLFFDRSMVYAAGFVRFD